MFPVDPPRDILGEEDLEAQSDRLLNRILHFPDGRRLCIERYRNESQLPEIMALVGNELSEPYSIYTYKYFVHYWPELCILAQDHDREEGSRIVGAIICKLEQPQQREGLLAQEEPGHEQQQQPPLDDGISSGYIAMLAVHQSYRGLGLGTRLVHTALRVMEERGCDEVVLETEVSNAQSLSLYGRLGFVRESRLFRYYLNGSDAFRLKLYLERVEQQPEPMADQQPPTEQQFHPQRIPEEDGSNNVNNNEHLLSTISAIIGNPGWPNDKDEGQMVKEVKEEEARNEGTPSTSSRKTHL